ncbi:MAG: ABC transporter substrate-binding protein [Bauldia sp.]|nr:ABC transporter substrate-binding protein [Bauldia sp.]
MNRLTITIALGAVTLAGPALAQEFPVTIPHALGEAVIPEAPQRIVTLGWISQDVVIALGEVPVGIARQDWGGNADGYLPWVADAVAATGAPLPVALDTFDGTPFEAILALEPDLILAPYAGLSDADYARLSAIAPTVAHAVEPWVADWRDVVRTVGRALGQEEEAEALLAETLESIRAIGAGHPEFAGRTFAYAAGDLSAGTVVFYGPTDPRVQLIEELGLASAPAIAGLPRDTFFYEVSIEGLTGIETDILVTWHNSDEDVETFRANPVVARYQPVVEGRFVPLVDRSLIMSTTAPSPLSLPWGMDRFVPLLAAVLAE